MSLFDDIKIGDTVTLRACRNDNDWLGDFLGDPNDDLSFRKKFNKPQIAMVIDKYDRLNDSRILVRLTDRDWWVNIGALVFDPEIILKQKLEKRTRFINRIEKRHTKKAA